MAKKKVGPKEEDSKLDDIEEDIFDKEDIDSHYPDVSNESVKKEDTPSAETLEQTEKVKSEEEGEEEEEVVRADCVTTSGIPPGLGSAEFLDRKSVV